MLLAVMLVIALGLGGLPLFAVLAAIGLIGLPYGNYAKGSEALPEFSIERFFFAGIVPGLLLVALLIGYCIVAGLRAGVPRQPPDLRGFARALWEAKWEVPIPFAIIASLI